MTPVSDNFPTPAPRPLILVVSSPSGGGKTTLCRMLLDAFTSMRYSVSCTTRPPRGHERDGEAYYFLTPAEFMERAARAEFLEHAVVHGHAYGTPRSGIEQALSSGYDILLDIDFQGARNLRRAVTTGPGGSQLRNAYVDVFIAPPSLDILAKRLRVRGEDSDAVIARRLQNARVEMAAAAEYQYCIVNDELDAAAETLRAIIVAEHHRNVSCKETP